MSSSWPLASDAAFPARDELLDVEAMRDYLAAAFGIDLAACTRVRATYRPGTSLKVLYRVETRSGSRLISARAFPTGRSATAWIDARATTALPGWDKAVVHIPALDAVFWVFPHDRKLRSLTTLADWSSAASCRAGSGWTTGGLVAYTPEKCATMRCVDGLGRTTAYAKAYVDDTGAFTQRAHDLLARHGVRVPAVLGYSVPDRILLVEAVQGRTLAALDGAERDRGFRQYGRELAALHRVPAPGRLPPFTRLDDSATVDAADTIARLCPTLSREVNHLAHRLRAADASDCASACLHGDAHFKNAIVTDLGATLIDLDQLSQGRPAAELGSVLAALEYESLVGRIDPLDARHLSEALLEGYATTGALPPGAALRAFTATALLNERAMRAVTRLRLDGLTRLDAIVERALALVREPARTTPSLARAGARS